jgi:cytochrome c peroxidase
MKKPTLVNMLLMFAAVIGALLLSSGIAVAQTSTNNNFTPPPYNPYPPGILPPDLVPEIARVQREVAGIENEAIAQWKALPPPTRTGQPPTLQGTGQRANQLLGKLMMFDLNMSPYRNQACAFCHMPYVGFSGPIPSVNLTMIAYPGSYQFRAGKRTPQRHTYAPYFPVLSYNQTVGLFFGGNFWDSRATGYLLANPDAEQAQHPPVDTAEHTFPDTACVAFRLTSSVYRPLFESVWGAGSLDIHFPFETESICDTPGGASVFQGNTTPIPLSPEDRTKANEVYDHWGQAVNQYQVSTDVSPASSKFDAFLAGKYTMTSDEMAGYQLFNGKGNCNSCHADGKGTTLTAAESPDNSAQPGGVPVFTCFGSANEGVPLNPRNAFYYETKPDAFGFVENPYGFGYRDLGLGTFLRSGFGAAPNPNSNWTQYAPTVDGSMQVSSVRNVAMTPSQCSTTEAGTGQPYFQKEFFHNGYFKSLKQVVHFYNTRDVYPYPVTSGHCPSGTIEKVTCWPSPEVNNPALIDMTTGNLGLTDIEENQIVAFLEILTDGYTTPYPDIGTFTGTCSVCNPATDPNCSPSTQGNGSLIPTPPLPPCASAICGVPPLPSAPITSQ